MTKQQRKTLLEEISPACKAIAERLDSGSRNFRDQLIQIAAISEEQAAKVEALYLKEKIAKQDFCDGVIRVKHGAFLGQDVIMRAVAM
jgi:hypothetical protein